MALKTIFHLKWNGIFGILSWAVSGARYNQFASRILIWFQNEDTIYNLNIVGKRAMQIKTEKSRKKEKHTLINSRNKCLFKMNRILWFSKFIEWMFESNNLNLKKKKKRKSLSLRCVEMRWKQTRNQLPGLAVM